MLHVWFHAVYLTLGSSPRITTNNVDIQITSIGEDGGGLPSLICHTDLTTCCRNVADNNGNGPLGLWTYPDGSIVLNSVASVAAGQQFFISRNSAQVIRLNRRVATNPVTPTGSYCCTVPTINGGDKTFCANLGEWIKYIIIALLCVLYHLVHVLYLTSFRKY